MRQNKGTGQTGPVGEPGPEQEYPVHIAVDAKVFALM